MRRHTREVSINDCTTETKEHLSLFVIFITLFISSQNVTRARVGPHLKQRTIGCCINPCLSFSTHIQSRAPRSSAKKTSNYNICRMWPEFPILVLTLQQHLHLTLDDLKIHGKPQWSQVVQDFLLTRECRVRLAIFHTTNTLTLEYLNKQLGPWDLIHHLVVYTLK